MRRVLGLARGAAIAAIGIAGAVLAGHSAATMVTGPGGVRSNLPGAAVGLGLIAVYFGALWLLWRAPAPAPPATPREPVTDARLIGVDIWDISRPEEASEMSPASGE